jgi:taurine dioxygenase
MFANMYAAYDALSPTYRKMIDGLSAVHDASLGAAYDRMEPGARATMMEKNPPVTHPLVQVHPETGRKALYAGSRVRNVTGMSRDESGPLLEFINSHAVRYEFTYRHRWRDNDLLMWDNRCALHYAVPDHDPAELRQMQRCSLLGPKAGVIAL